MPRRAAVLADLNTLDDVGWPFSLDIPREALHDIATCQLMCERHDVVSPGLPGVGKAL